jgi:azurin
MRYFRPMKKHLFIPVLAGSLLLAACGKKDEQSASNQAPSSPSANAPAASAGANFDVTANDTMKFNINRLEVKPGQDVKVTFTNTGTMAKNVMAHNFVLLKKDVDPTAFVNAAVGAQATDYIPADQSDKIIAHTKLLGPKQSEELTFKAPTEPGEYTYVCTFPAHYQSGMKGVLVVK